MEGFKTMVFSSYVFLIIFLPLAVLGYYGINAKMRKIFLILASFIFYAWGGLASFPILGISIVFNYLIALVIDWVRCRGRSARMYMVIMLVFNVGLLFTFKYLSPMVNGVYVILGVNVHFHEFILPLGISFYTFSAISYVLDVYFESSKAEKNFFNVLLYISFFPKIISGPIVKWETFEKQINNVQLNLDMFTMGIKRFIVGMGKKIIISDTLGIMVDKVFADVSSGKVPMILAWAGVVWYILQLYYDFAGYSDMAVGLGKMFGFELDENFDYPLTAKTIAEFWQRWHITLGTWVKHYIYTPVFRACSKKKNKKTGKRYSIKTCDYLALLVSWLIIGPWHGAGIKFIVYGLFYFFFIFLERVSDEYKKKALAQKKCIRQGIFWDKVLPHIYVSVVLIFGQMMFRADSMYDFMIYLKAMLGLAGNNFFNTYAQYLLKENFIITIIAMVFAMPLLPKIKDLAGRSSKGMVLYNCVETVALGCIMMGAIGFGAISSYDPFIYFNF